MSITLIPDSAPFSPEQRAWLNGFLSGWLGLQDGASTINGHALAAALVPDAPAESASDSETAEDHPWHDPALLIDERLKLAEDRPLPHRLMATMAQLDCGACGYLCKTYSEAIANGEETSLTLCSPGGSETSKALKRILKEGPTAPPKTNGHATNGHATNGVAVSVPSASAWSRKNPYPARVLRSVNLNQAGSAKQTHHVEIDLGDSGLTYEVGDALGVYPTNCPELVAEIVAELGATGDEPVLSLDGETVALSHALTRRCLSEISEQLLECLAEADRASADTLRQLIDDDALIQGFDVLDLLRRFPDARPDLSTFVAALAPIKPRLYSISSSIQRHPGQVHLTVGRVAYNHKSRLRKGVASTMLADRLNPGASVSVFVQKSHGFQLPNDPDAPIIMIGPGTGVAPFRAFLQERAEVGAKGPNWLFFGDQREALDFLYESELRQALDQGVLTRLDTAFSRDREEKLYVQHRMLDAGAELLRWLDAGAYLYVCGDAKRMAPDVDRALRQIVQTHGGQDSEQARAYVVALASAGRYRRDVY